MFSKLATVFTALTFAAAALMSPTPASAQTPPNPALRTSPCAVFYAGDSLTFSQFWDGQLYNKTLAARIGFSGEFAKPGLSVREVGPYVAARAPRMPKVVVLALGTADLYANTPPQVYDAQLRSMVKNLGESRKIIFVNIVFRRNAFDPNAVSKENAYNAILAKIDKQYPSVTTLDWSTFVLARLHLFDAKDWTNVHYNVAGSTARSNLYVAAVKTACTQR